MNDRMTVDRSSLSLGSCAVVSGLAAYLPRPAVIRILREAHDACLRDYRLGFVLPGILAR